MHNQKLLFYLGNLGLRVTLLTYAELKVLRQQKVVASRRVPKKGLKGGFPAVRKSFVRTGARLEAAPFRVSGARVEPVTSVISEVEQVAV